MVRRTTTLFATLLLAVCGCTSKPAAPPAAQAPATPVTAGQDAVAQADNPVQPPAPASPSDSPNKSPDNGDRPKLKSRFGRSLVEQLDRIEGGTGEERNLIHDTLRKNDETVDRALSNMSGRIEAANNTHDGRRRIAIPAP